MAKGLGEKADKELKKLEQDTKERLKKIGKDLDKGAKKVVEEADDMKLKNLRILSDFWPRGGVIKQYGLFREKNGFSERANVIVGVDGKVQWVKVYEISTLPDIDEVTGQLEINI